MKWTRNRFLPVCYAVVLVALAVVGCTSKQDPDETLAVCGNASCGDLIMVTTDTSSDGYQYLNPTMSPSGGRILFTADWWALPADPRLTEDVYFVNYRQMIIIPVQEGIEPTDDLTAQGAELIRLQEVSVMIGGEPNLLQGVLNDDKGDPIWEDEDHVLFFLHLNRVGNRLFRANLGASVQQPGYSTIEPLWMEPTDASVTPRYWQHMNPNLSADRRWLVFTRSGCAIPDSLETCTNLALYAMDMSTAGANNGYGALVFPLTREYSRVERPRFSPDGRTIVFSGGLDLAGGNGSGTELFTIDFDTTGLAAGSMALDNNLQRMTFTASAEGDPLTGVLNADPCYSASGTEIYFVSTRRAPTTTLHDRNVWRIPADGSRDPEIHFFSRYDDFDPTLQPDGSILLSSMVGFPTGMLNRLEDESYQRIKQENEQAHAADPEVPLLNETQLQQAAVAERQQLEYFAGVMAHLYLYRGN